MQQNTNSPRTASGSSSRVGSGADTFMVRDYGAPSRSAAAVNQGTLRAQFADADRYGIPQISALDVPGPTPPQAVLVTGDTLGAADAEGVRHAGWSQLCRPDHRRNSASGLRPGKWGLSPTFALSVGGQLCCCAADGWSLHLDKFDACNTFPRHVDAQSHACKRAPGPTVGFAQL